MLLGPCECTYADIILSVTRPFGLHSCALVPAIRLAHLEDPLIRVSSAQALPAVSWQLISMTFDVYHSALLLLGNPPPPFPPSLFYKNMESLVMQVQMPILMHPMTLFVGLLTDSAS